MKTRTAALAVVGLAALAIGVAAARWWPSSTPSLDCAPADVRWTDAGVAICASGAPVGPVPAAQGLTVGVKLDLNLASADELALVPGVGPQLARAIVDARTAAGGFKSWDEVDRIAGIGPSKLEALRASAEIR